MAKENDALKYALIIFVMLVVVLSISTYMLWKKADEKEQERVALDKTRNELTVKVNERDATITKLKSFMGWPENTDLADIERAFRSDMAVFPAGSSFKDYRHIAPLLVEKIHEESQKVAEHDDRTQKSELEKTNAITEKKAEVQKVADGLDTSKKDLEAERAQFNQQVAAVNAEKTKLVDDFGAQRKESDAQIAKLTKDLQDYSQQIIKLDQFNRTLSERAKRLNNEGKFSGFTGSVAWVNQTTSTAYVRLGLADGLKRQITFSVFDQTATTALNTKPKGKLEVVQIIDAHLAECRVVDDDPGNPILPDDKLYSPVWQPGLVVHFALAGFIDINGDGRSDLELVKNLILNSNGVIDAEINDEGKKKGTININTQFLVLGSPPTDAADVEMRKLYTSMVGEAAKYGVEQISAQKLLATMGYKGETRTVTLGRGANSADFKPKGDGPRVSTGNVSDAFRERRPPAAEKKAEVEKGDRGGAAPPKNGPPAAK